MRKTTTHNGISYVAEPWRGMDLSFFPDGNVRHGLLDHAVEIQGLPMCCEVAFYPSGRLMCGRLNKSVVLDSVEYYEYIYLFEDGRIRSSKLDKDTNFDGIFFQADTYVDFDIQHNVIAGCVASESDGAPFDSGTFIRFGKGRHVTRVTVPSARTWEQGRYGCSVIDGELAAWTNDQLGGTGTSCTLRDFLQGTLNEAVMSDLPFDEVWSVAEEHHSLISDIRPDIRLIL